MSKTGGGKGTNQHAVQGVSQERRQDAGVLGGLAEGDTAQGLEGINLAIPDDAWRPCGDADEPGGERAVLSTVIHIGGTGHHVVAYQVGDDTSEMLQVLQRDEDVDHYYAGCGASGTFETTEIAGAEYLVFVTPFD